MSNADKILLKTNVSNFLQFFFSIFFIFSKTSSASGKCPFELSTDAFRCSCPGRTRPQVAAGRRRARTVASSRPPRPPPRSSCSSCSNRRPRRRPTSGTPDVSDGAGIVMVTAAPWGCGPKPIMLSPSLLPAVLSLFTVVQFDNQPCAAASGDNGTCLTVAECASRGGMASGPCANSFGVCCVCE